MDELELTEFQRTIADFVEHAGLPGRHCARSAISHIQSAWKIRSIDPEMCVFRSLTAVEESTGAIFHSLKRHRYQGADKLRLRSHVHKAALRPFLAAIETNLAQSKLNHFSLALEARGNGKNGRVLLRFSVPNAPEGMGFGYPEPPLHFALARNGAKYYFTEELKSIISTHNAASVLEHVKDLANQRNRLLYASQEGVPKVAELTDDFLLKKRDVVFQHLCIYLMIDPYPQRQLFVQQALESFLKMLDLLPDDSSLEKENAAE